MHKLAQPQRVSWFRGRTCCPQVAKATDLFMAALTRRSKASLLFPAASNPILTLEDSGKPSTFCICSVYAQASRRDSRWPSLASGESICPRLAGVSWCVCSSSMLITKSSLQVPDQGCSRYSSKCSWYSQSLVLLRHSPPKGRVYRLSLPGLVSVTTGSDGVLQK